MLLKVWLILFVLVGIGALGYSFYQNGSPFKLRDVNLDQKTESEVFDLQQSIEDYYKSENSLPQSLKVLEDNKILKSKIEISKFDYSVQTGSTYTLCTNFQTSQKEPDSPSILKHQKGRDCFIKTLTQVDNGLEIQKNGSSDPLQFKVIIFVDKNNNQKQDLDEKGYYGAKMVLFNSWSGGDASTYADGSYTFYTIYTEIQSLLIKVPEGYISNLPSYSDGFINLLVDPANIKDTLYIPIVAGKSLFNTTESNQYYSLSGVVFIDINRNGTFDNDEIGYNCDPTCKDARNEGVAISIDRWNVDLTNDLRNNFNLFTDKDGKYSSSQIKDSKDGKIKSGIYKLRIDESYFPKYEPTTPANMLVNLITDKTINFGIAPRK